STANGMAIRFNQEDARPTGRNSSGVKGITLTGDDELVGMVVAEPEQTLLTVCENGFGKRTRFGLSSVSDGGDEPADETSGTARYRCQRRSGKGLRDIKAGGRNGRVIGIVRVDDADEILMMTSRGKIQRVAVNEIGIVGRNTKGVRIMKLDESDTLTAVVRVPPEEEANNTEDAPVPAPEGPSALTSPGEKAEDGVSPESQSEE
ncbi:MAG: DNA gyrase C-terminal beta-propeller domain-containing protein, partial [Planctomycetota bacterium]|nr:DNA gyrase C-terminal beta-propeller domain-containing protein [Planctomycetota bacterium]